ncbi:hypothetical protein D5047_00270 [Verminephrobacter eiseniae]|nr:hypothetical protein [Verminephrobacter eiseniae]
MSKAVLRHLATGQVPSLHDFEPVHRAALVRLCDRYQQILADLCVPPRPRNLPYYQIIKEMYPNFNVVDHPGQPQVESYFCGFKPNLLSYLLKLVPQHKIATTAKVSRMIDENVPLEVLDRCMDTLAHEGAYSLNVAEMRRFARWIGRGLRGESLTLISPVCPDYSYTGGESRQFRFTFERLNDGVGLAASRLLQSLPALRQLLVDELHLPIERHDIYLGDFEAFSAENCARLKITQQEFLKCLDGSRRCIDALSQGMAVAGLFTDLCGGEAGWHATYADLKRQLEAGEFGNVSERLGVTQIADARRPLYQRWYPEKSAQLGFLESLVVAQGLEYATMGLLIERSVRNPLVLAADHHQMAPFYTLAADIPVIYLDRNYE